MSTDVMIIVCVIGIGGYFLMGFLINAAIGSFMDSEVEDYIFATLLFWPLILLIGAIFQSIHFIKDMLKGEY